MSMNKAEPPPIPPATLQILIALADGARHGYAILKDIADRTGGQFHVGPATLYTSIKRMLQAGLVEEVADDADGGDVRRRYYRITPVGRKMAIEEVRRLDSVVSQARSRFSLRRPKRRGTT